MKIALPILASMVLFLQCKLDVVDPLAADFTVQDSSPSALVPVQFKDNSIGATTWAWNINGQAFSGKIPPEQTFSSEGSYSVSLTVTNGKGDSDTKTLSIPVGPCILPVANFEINGSPFTGSTISFSNQSSNTIPNNTNYLWDFGNGQTSTDPSPLMSYSIPGNYTVTLTAITPCGSNTMSKSIKIISYDIFMIDIPATNPSFKMGCNASFDVCNPEELPAHDVVLSAFQISQIEITQGQWIDVMAPSGIANPSYFSSCAGCPVEQVSWYDAVVFCNRLSQKEGLPVCYFSNYNSNTNTYSGIYGKNGATWALPNSGTVYRDPNAKGYRLPTEAEWERAARGGVIDQVYAGSNDANEVAWYDGNRGGSTKPT